MKNCKLTARVTPDLFILMDLYAQEHEITLSEFVRRAAEKYIADNGGWKRKSVRKPRYKWTADKRPSYFR